MAAPEKKGRIRKKTHCDKRAEARCRQHAGASSLRHARRSTRMSSPVLIEVVPSPRNIALPDETQEEWVAIDGGSFVTQADYNDESVMKAIYSLRAHSLKASTAIKKKKKCAVYFVDRCSNSKCTFKPGHVGQCSHEIVTGKRGGRKLSSFSTPPIC